jgi:hypothetical protein
MHPQLIIADLDISFFCREFVRLQVFDKQFEFLHLELWNDMSSGGQRRSAEEFAKYLEALIAPLAIKLHKVDTVLVSLEEEGAEVHCELQYELKGEDQVTNKRTTTTATIGFHHAYGYTYINRVELPGLPRYS